MAKRKIVKIDESKCDGCGQCISSCAEGALKLIDGKARLVSDTYCDGLGACLGECPQGAITIEERDAAPFDESLIPSHKPSTARADHHPHPNHAGCPGSHSRELRPHASAHSGCQCSGGGCSASELANWPVQLTLLNPMAPFLHGADLLLAADCVPFAYAEFHKRFLRGKPVAIGCPKLDDTAPYVEKLALILTRARPSSLTVVRMEVPCCGGLTWVAQQALQLARVQIPFTEIVISIQGEIVRESAVA